MVRLFSPKSGRVELPDFLAARRGYANDILVADERMVIIGGRRQFNFELRRCHPAADLLPVMLRRLHDAGVPKE